MSIKTWMILLFLALTVNSVSAASPETTKMEIEHLFSYLKSSNCQFNRNGNWYSASEAVDHLRMKYDSLVRHNQITDAESFIEHGASVSSVSGKSYQVKCGDAETMESRQWFMSELSRFRDGVK